MQAGSEKQPYFQLSTNEFGKHWLFYKPLESEPGKYSCWMPIDDEFYSEFNKLQKAALGSEAAVGQRSVDTVAEARDFRHCYIRTKIGCHCTDECGYDALMRGISDEGQP